MKIPILVVSIVVSIIVVGSLLVPVIDDYSDSTTPIETNIGADMARVTGDTDVTITVSGHTASVGGNDYTYNKVLISDRFYLQWVGGSVNALGLRGLDSSNQWTSANLSAATITVNGLTVSITGTATNSTEFSGSWDVNWAFYITEDGGYTFIETADTAFYVNNVENIWSYATFSTPPSGYATLSSAAGTTATVNKTGGTSETETIEYTVTEADPQIYKLTFSSTLYSIGVGANVASVQGIVVPTEAVGVPDDTTFSPILYAVPVVVILAILLGAVGIVIKGRY